MRLLIVLFLAGAAIAQAPAYRPKPIGNLKQVMRDIGREMGLHTTALGKVLLAYLPERQRADLLRGLVLTRRARKTIVSKAKLTAELAVVRQQGYATAEEEEEYAGVRSLGAPIYDSAREVRAAVALNGSLTEPAWRDPQALVELIQEAAAEISKRSRFV